MFTVKTIYGDYEQRVLLGFSESDSFFVTRSAKESKDNTFDDANKTHNTFEVSQTWHSFNDSRSSPWLRKSSPNASPTNLTFPGRGSPQNDTPVRTYSPSRRNHSINDLIEDEKDLKEYLR